MKIRRLKLVLLALPFLSIVSCSTVSRSMSSSAKVLNSSNNTLLQAPMVAELDAESATKVTSEMILTKAEGRMKEQEIKENAITKALDSSNSDVLVEPRFVLTKDGKGTILKVSVTGYATKYSKFRQMELSDSLLLDGIYGRQKIVKVYNEPMTETQAQESSLKSKLSLDKITNLLKKKKTSNSKPKKEKKENNNTFSASLNYSFLMPVNEGVDMGHTGMLSLGYGSQKLSGGLYSKISSIKTEESSFKNIDFGVYFQYVILKTQISPYVRANIGYKISDEVQYIDKNYVNSKKLDYGAELGVQYNTYGKGSFEFFLAANRMVYASQLVDQNFGIAEDYVMPYVGVRYKLSFGKKK